MSNALRSVNREVSKEKELEPIAVTLGEIADSKLALITANGFRPQRPSRIVYQFGLLFVELAKHIIFFEENYAKLCEQYCLEKKFDPQSNGYNFIFTKIAGQATPEEQENINKFSADVKELRETEIILSHKKIPDLLDLIPFTAQESTSLRWLVE
jgi:hypothetical protein